MRRDNIEQFADILANAPEVAAAIRAGRPEVEDVALARRVVSDGRTATRPGRLRCRGHAEDVVFPVHHSGRDRIALDHGDLEILERKLELCNLALDLLRT